MKKISLLALFLTIGLFTTGLIAQDMTADQIITKHLDAMGGLDKWKAVKTMTASGTGSMGMMEFPFSMFQKAPNKMKIEVKIAEKMLIPQCFDGTVAWELNPFNGGDVPKKQTEEQTKEMADNDFPSELVVYKDKNYKAELAGTEAVQGAKCYKVKLTKKENKEKLYFFDVENFALIMVRETATTGEAKGTVREEYFSDYQKFDGLMFPTSLVTKVNGEEFNTITIKEAKFNAPLEDAVFAFPGGK